MKTLLTSLTCALLVLAAADAAIVDVAANRFIEVDTAINDRGTIDDPPITSFTSSDFDRFQRSAVLSASANGSTVQARAGQDTTISPSPTRLTISGTGSVGHDLHTLPAFNGSYFARPRSIMEVNFSLDIPTPFFLNATASGVTSQIYLYSFTAAAFLIFLEGDQNYSNSGLLPPGQYQFGTRLGYQALASFAAGQIDQTMDNSYLVDFQIPEPSVCAFALIGTAVAFMRRRRSV